MRISYAVIAAFALYMFLRCHKDQKNDDNTDTNDQRTTDNRTCCS